MIDGSPRGSDSTKRQAKRLPRLSRILQCFAFIFVSFAIASLFPVTASIHLKDDDWQLIDKNGTLSDFASERFDNLRKNEVQSYELPKGLEACFDLSPEGVVPVRRKIQYPGDDEYGLFDVKKKNYRPIKSIWQISKVSEGLCLIYGADGYGYADTLGKIVIPEQFPFASDFEEGLAIVVNHNHWAFIDHSGRVVIRLPDDCSFAGSYSEGLAAVALGAEASKTGYAIPNLGAKWGFVDKTGRLVIPAMGDIDSVELYPPVPKFSEGVAPLAVREEGNLKFGFIDTSGHWKIKPQFKNASGFRNGRAEVAIGHSVFKFEDWTSNSRFRHRK